MKNKSEKDNVFSLPNLILIIILLSPIIIFIRLIKNKEHKKIYRKVLFFQKKGARKSHLDTYC